MVVGIFYLPVDAWIKGYMGMGLFFVVGSSITLSKTMRDQHEAEKLISQINNARTEKIIQEYAAWAESKPCLSS